MKNRILVAGIGNIFLGDDTFGVEVVKRLAQRQLPEEVTIRDFGIRSYDLAYALMDEWDLAILVDALPRGGAPGTLYTLKPELAGGAESVPNLNAHTMNPVAVLQLVAALGGKTGRILVVGCEPASIEPDAEGNMGLTAEVNAAVGEALHIVEDLITKTRSEAMAA